MCRYDTLFCGTEVFVDNSALPSAMQGESFRRIRSRPPNIQNTPESKLRIENKLLSAAKALTINFNHGSVNPYSGLPFDYGNQTKANPNFSYAYGMTGGGHLHCETDLTLYFLLLLYISNLFYNFA
jgi:hypothetical protein